MRPHYLSSKMKHNVNKKKFSRKRHKFCGCPGIPTLNFDDVNQILRENKLRLSTEQGSWKVMPKDSCEVYKERRERQKRNEQSNESDNSQIRNKKERRSKKPARKAKHRYRLGQRRRYRKRSSSCSCCHSQQTSCSHSTGTEDR